MNNLTQLIAVSLCAVFGLRVPVVLRARKVSVGCKVSKARPVSESHRASEASRVSRA